MFLVEPRKINSMLLLIRLLVVVLALGLLVQELPSQLPHGELVRMVRCENSGGAQLKHKPFWTLKAAGGWHGPYGTEKLEKMCNYHQLTNIAEWYMAF